MVSKKIAPQLDLRIRKTPLKERLLSLPFDYYLSLSEWWATKTWNEPAIAVAVGGLANAMMMACSSLYEPFDGVFQQNPRSRPALACALVLFLGSSVNMIVSLKITKKYSLLAQPVDERPKSNNATLDEDVWVLNIWRPDTLWFYTLQTFSPVHALAAWFAPAMAAVLINVGLSALLFVVSMSFQSLVNDRFIVDSNVMKEYTCKVVYPATSVATRDVSVQTDRAKVLAGPSTPRREFIQRDVRTPHTPLRSPTHSPMRTPMRTPLRALPTKKTSLRTSFAPNLPHTPRQ